MESNLICFAKASERLSQMQRLPPSDGHRFFTRSYSGNRTQNVLLKVLSREYSGYFASGLNRRSNEKPFQEVPEQLQFCLKDIVPYCFLNGHMFMGLTSCGQFLLSYKLSYDYEEPFENDFCSIHKYELYFWIYRPHMLLSKYFHVCLFDDHGVDEIKSVTITQWKTDNQLLIVHGGNMNDESDSYVTMVRVPKLGCLDCKQVRDAHNGDEERQDILCIGCNMTIHMKYRNTDSGPRFNPNFNLNCPGYVIMSENSFIHTIHVELDTKRSQQRAGATAVLSSKYLRGAKINKHLTEECKRAATCREPEPISSLKQQDMATVPKRCEVDTLNNGSNSLLNPKMSIAEQIIADFAEYETDMYETKCSIRSYPDNFDELIITSPVASVAMQDGNSTEPNTAKVRLMNHRNNTNIELRFESVSGAASSSGTYAGPSSVPVVHAPHRKSFVTRVDLQSNDSQPRQDAFNGVRITNPSVPMCDMSFTASSSTTAPTSLISRSPLRRRFDFSESSYVPNAHLVHQQSALSLQHCVVNGNDGANFHAASVPSMELDADAAKAYEFSEDNERCEKISTFRKRRLADKKYEFSEEPTSEENIEPFNRLRNQIRNRVAAPGYGSAHHHASFVDMIPTTHHLHRASPSHGFRSPCGSPVGNRYLRSPPGIRSPSYYRHRSPSSQGTTTVNGSVVLLSTGGVPTGASAGTAIKQLKRNVPLDPRDFIQILSPSAGISSGLGGSGEAGAPDIPKFFLDAIQKINEKKMANELLLHEGNTNNENNINCDNQLPIKRSANDVTLPTDSTKPAEQPTCTKKIVKIYVEEDDANSVVTTEEDDCISPGYHASLPMEVHGSCYSNMQIISQASFNKLHCPAVVVTQNSFDMETFSFHVANYICAQDGKKYGILLDSAYELTHVCPLTKTITCTTVLQFTANDIGNKEPTSCHNCTASIDCQMHRKVYQCRSLFTWCITTGEWTVLDYGNLTSGPYLDVKKLASNYNHLLKKLRSFTKKLFSSSGSTGCESESNRTYEYLNHLRVLDSDTSKAKRRLTDLDNMIEFYLRHPRRDDEYRSDSDSYGEEEEDEDDEEEEDEEEEDEDWASSIDDALVRGTSIASDTVSEDDDL